jgi:anaerobic selenocysteine-containing dehydrogenase
MIVNIIVGILFFAVIAYGAMKSYKSMRSNTCPGCSGGCSMQERKSCQSKKDVL